MRQVWIVDDDRAIRWILEKALSRAGIGCRVFSSADDVLAAFRAEVPLVLVSDIRMPGMSGVELLSQVRREHPAMPVIIMTAFSDLDSAVASFQKGAFEYLTKPFDIDKAVGLIRRALESCQKGPGGAAGQVSGLVGQASSMQPVFRAVGRLAGSEATVLITGETGCGKEVVARSLHSHSVRAQAPFVPVCMAGVPQDVLEDELFGHEKGAFAGAQERSRGRIEQACGGTLFLDEVGGLPLPTQRRLVQLLADGTFCRLGGHDPIKADVRIIASTNQDLESLVRRGTFLADLLHRLGGMRIAVPALRERSEDIGLLADHFLAQAARKAGTGPKRLDREVQAFLKDFRFPGNVRQLENLCRWLALMAPSDTVHMADLPADILSDGRRSEQGGRPADSASGWLGALREEVERRIAQSEPHLMANLTQEFERVVLQVALEHTGGKKIEAAQRLGLGRNTVTRKVQELHLEGKADT